MTRLKVESTRRNTECKVEVTSLSPCIMKEKEKCFGDASLLEHFVVGSEPFEETKINAYEPLGSTQHFGMVASRKPQSSKTISKKFEHKSLIRKRKLSITTPNYNLITSGILRSPTPLKKRNRCGFENIAEHGINRCKKTELPPAFCKFKGELKVEAFTRSGFSGLSAFISYSEFISCK